MENILKQTNNQQEQHNSTTQHNTRTQQTMTMTKTIFLCVLTLFLMSTADASDVACSEYNKAKGCDNQDGRCYWENGSCIDATRPVTEPPSFAPTSTRPATEPPTPTQSTLIDCEIIVGKKLKKRCKKNSHCYWDGAGGCKSLLRPVTASPTHEETRPATQEPSSSPTQIFINPITAAPTSPDDDCNEFNKKVCKKNKVVRETCKWSNKECVTKDF